MIAPSTHEVTGLLKAWSAGDKGALEKLTPLVYEELHRAARRYMGGERSEHIFGGKGVLGVVIAQPGVTWAVSDLSTPFKPRLSSMRSTCV